MDDYSADAAAMRVTTDPYPASSESLATSLQGELERIRYLIAQITGKTYWYQDPDGTFATLTGVETLTNKRITARIGTVASSATPTPDGDANDIFTVTALAEAATFAAPTGTPSNGQKLIIRIKDNATARALAWNAIYRAGTDIPLPTTTVISKTMYCGFIYNSVDTKWDLVAFVDKI